MRRGARQMMASTKNDPHPHGPHVITYSATLDVPEATAVLLADLLIAERRRRGTGRGARAASAREQALLVLRWFREDADMKILARNLTVSVATGYRYLHEGIDVLARRHQTCTRCSRPARPPAGPMSCLTAPSSAPTAAERRTPTP